MKRRPSLTSPGPDMTVTSPGGRRPDASDRRRRRVKTDTHTQPHKRGRTDKQWAGPLSQLQQQPQHGCDASAPLPATSLQLPEVCRRRWHFNVRLRTGSRRHWWQTPDCRLSPVSVTDCMGHVSSCSWPHRVRRVHRRQYKSFTSCARFQS
jgi:hypothetical protein